MVERILAMMSDSDRPEDLTGWGTLTGAKFTCGSCTLVWTLVLVLAPPRAWATALAMAGCREETTVPVREETEGEEEEEKEGEEEEKEGEMVFLVAAVGPGVKRGAGGGGPNWEEEEERGREGREKEEEDWAPLVPAAVREEMAWEMAGPSWLMTSPTTCLSLICGAD